MRRYGGDRNIIRCHSLREAQGVHGRHNNESLGSSGDAGQGQAQKLLERFAAFPTFQHVIESGQNSGQYPVAVAVAH